MTDSILCALILSTGMVAIVTLAPWVTRWVSLHIERRRQKAFGSG
jgi:hypothetical protein